MYCLFKFIEYLKKSTARTIIKAKLSGLYVTTKDLFQLLVTCINAFFSAFQIFIFF